MSFSFFAKYGYWIVIVLISLSFASTKRYRRPDFCKNINKDASKGSFLWEIKRDPPSYFFGTIHVPYTRVWDHVPDNAKRAFQMSDSVFFELDLTDSYTISALTSCQLLPKGKNLSKVLPRELFSRLKNHLSYIRTQMPSWVTQDQRGRGLYADYLFNAITGNWERKRPVWVMLMVNSLTKGDIRSRGVPVLDLFLAQEAEKLKKNTGAVEKVDEQCVPLNTLNFSQGVFALDHTLSQQESVRAGLATPTHSTDALIDHYNCGNLNALVLAQDSPQASSLSVPHLGNSSLPPVEAAMAQRIDEYFRKELILRRNERMGIRVAQILRDNPDQSFFFAFGAGHFLGANSVLDVVRKQSFKIEHVNPDQKIKRRKKKRGSKGGFVPKLSILKNFSLPSNNLRPDHQMDPAFARFLSERNHEISIKSYRESVTTAVPRKSFNDLWIRITSETSGPTSNEGRNDLDSSEENDESLRVWYGLPQSSASALSYSKFFLLLPSLQIYFYVR